MRICQVVVVCLVRALAGLMAGSAFAAAPVPSATALMDWAERTYPNYFPGPQANRQLPPYTYRYYPATGNYLGVSGTSVYVLGPIAGSEATPMYVGDLAGFACQVSPASCGPGTGPVRRLASATDGGHTLAVNADGSVWAMGTQPTGQFGDGTLRDTAYAPRQVAPPGSAVGVAAGTGHSSVLKADGEVWTAGSNLAGVLGSGQIGGLASVWQRASVIDGVARLTSNSLAQIAVRTDGTVWRWGDNLGGGNLDAVTQSIRLGSFSDAVDATMSSMGAFIVRADGTVWFWGRELSLGESGGALPAGGSSGDLPRQVPGLDNVVAVAAGAEHALALKRDGTVWSWGGNAHGQLGYQDVVIGTTPKPVPDLGGVVAVAAGRLHSMALHGDGGVTTWGSLRELRCQGAGSHAPFPARVAGITDAIAVAGAGQYGMFIVRRDGSVWACGSNSMGSLGLGEAGTRASVPTLVQGLNLN